MVLLYQEPFERPETLEGRFENDFPLIYIGDRVVVSSRWAGRRKNPDEGKSGQVIKIHHGFQSIFNRDYLILKIQGDESQFYTWLYTLDLVERTPENAQLFKSGELVYIDDRVEVVDGQHPRFSRTGNVRYIARENGNMIYEVRDGQTSKKVLQLENEILGMGAESELRESDGSLTKFYEMALQGDVVKGLVSQLGYKSGQEFLNEASPFLVNGSSVKLVEIFPPNKLFRVE